MLVQRLLGWFAGALRAPFFFKDAPPFLFEGSWAYSKGFWGSILKASGFYLKGFWVGFAGALRAPSFLKTLRLFYSKASGCIPKASGVLF